MSYHNIRKEVFTEKILFTISLFLIRYAKFWAAIWSIQQRAVHQFQMRLWSLIRLVCRSRFLKDMAKLVSYIWQSKKKMVWFNFLLKRGHLRNNLYASIWSMSRTCRSTGHYKYGQAGWCSWNGLLCET